MLVKNITELYDADYNITNIFSMEQYWKNNSVFKMTSPRESACMLYLCGCDAVYTENDKTFTVEKNSVIYIPRGTIYETQFINCQGCASVLLEFNLITPESLPFNIYKNITVLTKNADPLIARLFNMASDIFSSTIIAIPKLKSVIYDILTELSTTHRWQKIYSKKFNSISKGIACLCSEKNFNLSVDEIAQICHVSSSTFRRMNPSEYRTFAQIEYAKKLLSTGAMTVPEAAVASGFNDSAYFCRVFKKITGFTPSEYCNSTKKG